MSRGASAASARPAAAAPRRNAAADDSDDDDGPVTKPTGVYKTDPKADALVADAAKKLKAFSLFNSSKHEDAIEMLEKAASIYKMNKNWQEAGQAYEQCAEINAEKIKDVHSTQSSWENAAKAYKNVNLRQAIKCYTNAVDILMENNKFAQAAKLWKEMGMLYEKESDIDGAIRTYQKAADCYEADNSTANANGMFIKVADLTADAEEYKKAISIYEKVARTSVENSALRWSVKDHLFKALLCHLVLAAPSHQLEGVTRKLDSYVDMCPHLDNTREKSLIEELVQDFADNDPDAFADHVFRFDEIMPLDRWKSKVLLQVKKALEGGNPEDNAVGV